MSLHHVSDCNLSLWRSLKSYNSNKETIIKFWTFFLLEQSRHYFSNFSTDYPMFLIAWVQDMSLWVCTEFLWTIFNGTKSSWSISLNRVVFISWVSPRIMILSNVACRLTPRSCGWYLMPSYVTQVSKLAITFD